MRKFFKKELRKPFAVIIFTILCLFFAIKLLGPIPVTLHTTQTTQANLFHIMGTGKVSQIPNCGLLMFSVTKTATTVADAQNQAHTTIETILNGIKSSTISAKDISTINYTVFPQYAADSTGKQIVTGYTVTQDMQMKVTPIDATSNVLDIITTNGANQIGGIAFTFDDDTQKKLEEKARENAVINAREKAKTLATSAGIILGRIVDIQEEPRPTAQPIPFTATAVNSSTDQTLTQLPTGTNTVTVSVTISYEIE